MPHQAPTPIEVTRLEEHLRVDTDRVPVERIRFERVVVTEQRTVTVEVRHEEIRLTREPIAGAADRGHQAPQGQAPIVVILREEQVEIVKKTVPIEKVTLHVDTVTVQQDVTDNVRREHIDYEPPVELA